jgi:hypothetical protein
VHVQLDRIDVLRRQVARAAAGISFGAAIVIWTIVASHGIGWPIGSEGTLHAAATVTALALGVWIICRFGLRR